MKFLILDDKQREAIAKVNAGISDRQLSPVPLPDSRWAINADVLEDPGTWGKHLAGLAGIIQQEGTEGTEIIWQSANGKVEPVRQADRVVVEEAIGRLAGTLAPPEELDPAKDCYQMDGANDAVVLAEISAKYEGEKARLAAALAPKAIEEISGEGLEGKVEP